MLEAAHHYSTEFLALDLLDRAAYSWTVTFYELEDSDRPIGSFETHTVPTVLCRNASPDLALWPAKRKKRTTKGPNKKKEK